MKVLAVGGGSGGHVTPVVAVINELHQLQPDVEVHFVCDRAFESQARGLMEKASVPVKVSVIAAGKFRRYSHLTFWQHFTVPHVVIKNTTDLVKIFGGFIQSLGILIFNRPDVVFAKGGYVCLPLGLAARLLRIPLIIHDSDTRPGLTNRILSRFAHRIATGAPLENYNYNKKISRYVGVPIGSQFTPVSTEDQQLYKEQLGLDPAVPLVVATGGGLGAPSINNAVIEVASRMTESPIQFYNVTGKKHYDGVVKASQGLVNYIAVPFVYEKMERVLGAADVVISRGSATFLQELAGLEKASVVVPAHQLGDQIKNAEVYKKAEAAIILTDDELKAVDPLEVAIVKLMSDAGERERIASNLHAFARPSAARDVAEMIYEAAK